MKNKVVLLYIALATGITWLLWIPALVMVSQKGYPLPTIDYLLAHRTFQFINGEHALMVLSFSLAVYGPLVAGWVASRVEGGRSGAAAWFAPVLRWKVGPRWLGVVLAIAAAIVALPVFFGLLVGLVSIKPDLAFPSLGLILALFLYQLLTSGLGEEPGWRGYLLPRWQASHSYDKAVWWTGVVWGIWHFPFTIFVILQSAPDLSLPAQLSMLVPALGGQMMSLIGMTYIYAWLVGNTRSVFLAMLFHALGNTINALVLAVVIANPIVNLAVAAMPWLLVWVLEKAVGKEAFAGNLPQV